MEKPIEEAIHLPCVLCHFPHRFDASICRRLMEVQRELENRYRLLNRDVFEQMPRGKQEAEFAKNPPLSLGETILATVKTLQKKTTLSPECEMMAGLASPGRRQENLQ